MLLDQNAWHILEESVRPVDEDPEAEMLFEAIGEHIENVDVYEAVSSITFRDEQLGDSGLSFHNMSSLYWKDEIEASNVPMFVMSSWFDAGTADGALLRFNNYTNPQKLMIMATDHSGVHHASPYVVGDELLEAVPSVAQQWTKAAQFFDFYLKGADNGVDDWPAVTYYNLGEEEYRETDVWPPEKTRKLRLFMDENYQLSSKRPRGRNGADDYEFDFDVTTGPNSRWLAQWLRPVLNLNDRGDMDGRMLTYTSEPLPVDIQITGYPVARLNVTSTHEDGAFLVYLEDVDENGRSIYLTEGGLRAIHRQVSENPYNEQTTPYHSFEEADGRALVPGKPAKLKFELQPVSVQIQKGHRIRVAIAGADMNNFDRIPPAGAPSITLHRSKKMRSFIDIPLVVENKKEYLKIKKKLMSSEQ